jgi:hypothetical protein
MVPRSHRYIDRRSNRYLVVCVYRRCTRPATVATVGTVGSSAREGDGKKRAGFVRLRKIVSEDGERVGGKSERRWPGGRANAYCWGVGDNVGSALSRPYFNPTVAHTVDRWTPAERRACVAGAIFYRTRPGAPGTHRRIRLIVRTAGARAHCRPRLVVVVGEH